ncbi:MAG TPA: signal peptidase II [Gammaproteobacteria bacterium]|nr:signal peptidase II [Gammaproteobacteria bacterium]
MKIAVGGVRRIASAAIFRDRRESVHGGSRGAIPGAERPGKSPPRLCTGRACVCGRQLRPPLLFIALIAGSTVGCDHVTKYMATALLAAQPAHSYLFGAVRLEYAENVGGFLGLGAGLPSVIRTAIFACAGGLALLVLLVPLIRSPWSASRAYGFALFFAGGLSNWIDRVFHGAVVDFLNVGIGGFRTGIFNLADVSIMLGIAFSVLSGLSSRGGPEGAPKRVRDG